MGLCSLNTTHGQSLADRQTGSNEEEAGGWKSELYRDVRCLRVVVRSEHKLAIW